MSGDLALALGIMGLAILLSVTLVTLTMLVVKPRDLDLGHQRLVNETVRQDEEDLLVGFQDGSQHPEQDHPPREQGMKPRIPRGFNRF